MALGNLFNVPETDNQWNEYSFSLQAMIRDINRRIIELNGPQLPEFPLDPIIKGPHGVQLSEIQVAMDDINRTLGLQGFNYEDVDLADRNERSSWVWLLAQNIRQAAQLVGVG